MFSGKTGGLIDEIDRQEKVRKKSIIVKPSIDTRYNKDKVVSHSGKDLDAYRVNKKDPRQILQLIKEKEDEVQERIDIVAIDEIQFFRPKVVIEVVEQLLKDGRVVIVAGLPTDFTDKPFGAVPYLIAKADVAIQERALCTCVNEDGSPCGLPASKTQRFVDGKPARFDDPVVVIGGSDLYEARCRQHHAVQR
jgi:thymidine kinase